MSNNSSVKIREVPFFDYSKMFARYQEALTEIFQDVLRRGAFILQRDLEEFEERLKKYTGAKHVFGVADGTNAILLLLRCLNIEKGDEVILPSHTFIATAAAVHYSGATPLLADCGKDHLIDVDSVERLISKKCKAIIPVQLNGRTADMERLMTLAKSRNIPIIEDAAQALGSKFCGKCAGTFGIGGTISFYPAKTLGCLGDGGAILTNSSEVAERIGELRDHGRDPRGNIVSWGTNCRLDNLQAAFLSFKLHHYHREVEDRRAIASRYHEGLSHLAELTLPPPPDDGAHFDVFQNYEIEAEEREALRNHLKERGIATIVQWGGKPLHQLQNLNFRRTELANTEELFKKCLLLPIYPTLEEEEIDYVISTICEFYGY